jgi:hypothetical protein
MLLQNVAFQAATETAQINDVSSIYLLTAIGALASALVYMFHRYEVLSKKIEVLIRENIESKHELSEAIRSLNRDAEERHRSMERLWSERFTRGI